MVNLRLLYPPVKLNAAVLGSSEEMTQSVLMNTFLRILFDCSEPNAKFFKSTLLPEPLISNLSSLTTPTKSVGEIDPVDGTPTLKVDTPITGSKGSDPTPTL